MGRRGGVTATSSLDGRVVFVLATPETGVEPLLRAFDRLPGVSSAPVATHLVSQGIGSLLDTWTTRIREAMGERADEKRFLALVRHLADAPLAAWCRREGAERVVEYSPDHITYAATLASVYPDAEFVHLVRDGRHVASALSSPLLDWPPAMAARRWCDDQRAVLALGSDVSVHTVRIEDLVRDPAYYVTGLASRLGIAAEDSVLAEAAEAVGNGPATAPTAPVGRVGRLVEQLGHDLLVDLDYEVAHTSSLRALAARAELGTAGEIAWMVRTAASRLVAAVREQ